MNENFDVRLIKESDIIWGPICLFVLFAIGYSIRRKYRGTPLEQYFFPALFLRFLFAFIYALVIQFYYGYGDTSMYYQAVIDMRIAIVNEPSLFQEIFFNLKLDKTSSLYPYFVYDGGAFTQLYMLNVSNYMVPRFALPFSILFFDSYLCICFCISFFSFAGCWRIFKMFYEMYPHLKKKLAIATLFLPSILFWGGPLLKDSICIGAMGFALYAAYSIVFRKRKVFISFVILILVCALLFYIKPYILLCLLPAFLLWIFLQFRSKIEDRTLRRIAGILFAGASLILGFFALQALTASELTGQYSSEKILQTVQGVQGSFVQQEGGGSGFTVGNVGSSTTGFLLLLPAGLMSTFFRPFLWEVANPLMLLSSLEALGFLWLTLLAFKRIGIRRFFSLVFTDSVIVFCFVYSIFFAGIIGVTTTNFGALVRYKIPCIPFYLIMLFLVMHKSGKFSPNVIFSKKFF
jgi:hypothetical protein